MRESERVAGGRDVERNRAFMLELGIKISAPETRNEPCVKGSVRDTPHTKSGRSSPE